LKHSNPPKVQTEFSGVKTIPLRGTYASRRQTSGQRENFHPGRTSRPQGSTAFVNRTSGGKDIVDQEHSFPRHGGRIGKTENIFQIAPSLFPGEQRLGKGRTVTEQQARLDPVLPLWETTPSKNESLVKSPLA